MPACPKIVAMCWLGMGMVDGVESKDLDGLVWHGFVIYGFVWIWLGLGMDLA